MTEWEWPVCRELRGPSASRFCVGAAMIYGEQIRIPGARPITRGPASATMEVRSTQDNWDKRFWLGKIPQYDSARDPHVSKMRRPNSHSLPGLRISSSRLTMSRTYHRDSNLPSSVPKSPSKPLFLPPDSGMQEMRRDLESTWEREHVPSFYREAYLRRLDSMTTQTAAVTISRELTEFQQKKTPIQVINSAIAKRENLLTQIKELESDMEDERLLQLDLRDLLQQLQRVSIEIVEHISGWRDASDTSAPFLYEGENYLLKMRSDLAPLVEGPLGKFLVGIEEDPLLVRMLAKGERRQGSTMAARLKSRAQDAELVLAQEPDPQPSPSPLQAPEVLQAATPLDHSLSLSGRGNAAHKQQILDLAKMIAGDLVGKIVNEDAPVLCREACEEYQTAHMVLYTNKILDDVISLALKEQIPICAHESYTEEIDREFITLQKQIMEAVIAKEVADGVDSWALEVVAEELTREFSAMVEVDDIVEESIAEEAKLNQQMIADIFQRLIDSYMSEEWLEIMCEDVLSDEILNERLDQLPMPVLKQVLRENPKKHMEKMAENCYFTLLFQYVGDQWLRRVAEEAVREANGEGEAEGTPDVFFVRAETNKRLIRRYTRLMDGELKH